MGGIRINLSQKPLGFFNHRKPTQVCFTESIRPTQGLEVPSRKLVLLASSNLQLFMLLVATGAPVKNHLVLQAPKNWLTWSQRRGTPTKISKLLASPKKNNKRSTTPFLFQPTPPPPLAPFAAFAALAVSAVANPPASSDSSGRGTGPEHSPSPTQSPPATREKRRERRAGGF